MTTNQESNTRKNIGFLSLWLGALIFLITIGYQGLSLIGGKPERSDYIKDCQNEALAFEERAKTKKFLAEDETLVLDIGACADAKYEEAVKRHERDSKDTKVALIISAVFLAAGGIASVNLPGGKKLSSGVDPNDSRINMNM